MRRHGRVSALPRLDIVERTTGFRGQPLAYVDIETTGLSPENHEIIEVSIAMPDAFMRLRDPVLVPGWRVFTAKMLPHHIQNAEPNALAVNGYDETVWRKKAVPRFGVFETIEALLVDQSATIVGHNVWLDVEFLSIGLNRHLKVDWRPKYRIDTPTLIWERLTPLGLVGGSLADACHVCGISNEGAHTAKADVRRTKALVDFLTTSAFSLNRSMVRKRIADLNAQREIDRRMESVS